MLLVPHFYLMQVELAKLAVEGMKLDLPPHEVDGVKLPARKANIRSADSLRGTLTTDDKGFRLGGVAATELALNAVDWHFGKKIFLTSERLAKLGGLRAQIDSGADNFDLDVELASLQAERLNLNVGGLKITAELDAVKLQLAVHGDDVGYLRADQALLKDFELRSGEMVISMPSLRVRELLVDWGGELFRMEAATAEGETLVVTQQGNTISANDVALAALGLHGDDVKLGRASFAKLMVEATLPSTSERGEEKPAAPHSPMLDYALLDGLAGHLNVDVHVDLAIPIIQHRRATHELRIPIDRGTIDYRKLEKNLAPLEDSLIDFSVRDGGLVLEVGLPLIRTRGRGKPILRWDLSPHDLELAEDRLVRLAVLPHVRPATPSEAPKVEKEKDEDKESSFRLRSLSLQNLETVLALAPAHEPYDAALRAISFDSLQLTGGVHYDPESEPREGTVRGSLENLHAAVQDLPVGSSALRGDVTLGALRDLSVNFTGLKPSRVKATLEGLALQGVALGEPEAKPARALQPGSPITSASANPS